MSKLLPSKALKKARMTERKANKDTTKIQLTADEKFAKKSQIGRANRDERKNEKVLSVDQFKRWEDMKDQRNQRMNKRMAYHKTKTN
jgi:hypothetical protein